MKTKQPALSWLRIAGTHIPAHEVLARATPALAALQVVAFLPATSPSYDYTQIDPALDINHEAAEPPQTATGYAGLSPAQRGAYQQWATAPRDAAPLAFRQLYAANLETALIEQFLAEANANTALLHTHMLALCDSPAWQKDDLLPRILLLEAWLHGDGNALHDLSASGLLSPALLNTAVTMQTLLPNPVPLSAAQALLLAKAWRVDTHGVDQQLLALRLSYLSEQLQAEPLQHALAELDRSTAPRVEPSVSEMDVPPTPASRLPLPWRSNHRDLRLALPQPNLCPLLEPLLATLFTEIDVAVPHVSAPAAAPAEPDSSVPATKAPARNGSAAKTRAKSGGKQEWTLVLEFSESRSQYYTFALELAQREQNYQPLLDERRQIIHRVHYRKHELRRFWRLWDYVQTWSDSRVYVNGNELEKWQIWPWSQYLR